MGPRDDFYFVKIWLAHMQSQLKGLVIKKWPRVVRERMYFPWTMYGCFWLTKLKATITHWPKCLPERFLHTTPKSVVIIKCIIFGAFLTYVPKTVDPNGVTKYYKHTPKYTHNVVCRYCHFSTENIVCLQCTVQPILNNYIYFIWQRIMYNYN